MEQELYEALVAAKQLQIRLQEVWNTIDNHDKNFQKVNSIMELQKVTTQMIRQVWADEYEKVVDNEVKVEKSN